jgi:hypothetical protein
MAKVTVLIDFVSFFQKKVLQIEKKRIFAVQFTEGFLSNGS